MLPWSNSRRVALRAPLILLAALVTFATLYKIAAFERSPRFNPFDETCQFWTESAFHYRHACMVARGEWIPALDRDVQRPEGVETYKELTPGMEYPAGLTYRFVRLFAPDLPFHRWLVWFVCAFSSLSIIAAFVAGSVLWRSQWLGLVSAFAYGLSPLSFNRLVGNYGREDFALPILFFAFASFLAAMQDTTQRRAWSLRAALPMAIGLLVWHVSRFYALFFFLLLAPAALLASAPRAAIAKSLRGMLAVLLVAGLTMPALQGKAFLTSPSFIVGLALLAAIEIARRKTLAAPRAYILFAVIAIPLLLAAGWLSPGEREYSHVTGLAIEKLRHLGQKPADPSDLPYDARVLWVEAFESPQPAALLVAMSTLVLWGGAALAAGARRLARRALDAPTMLVVLHGLFYLLLYLLLERFSPFFIFFLALLIPIVVPRPGTRLRLAVIVLLAATGIYEIAYDLRFDKPNPWRTWAISQFPPKAAEAIPNFGNNERVVRWIRAHVPGDATILTWYPTGPMVITYTGRPIVLHSKFESKALRDKERRMIEALYGDEEGFHRLAAEFEADFFLYQANLLLDASTSSSRYMADRLDLPATSAAFRFHFQPDSLRHFALIYQDSFYRLYKRRTDGEIVVPPTPIPYEEMFDPAIAGPVGERLDDRLAARVVNALVSRLTLTKQATDAYARSGKDPDTRANVARACREILRASPDCADALAQLALIASDDGRLEEARFLLSRALTTHPEYPELHTVRGILLERENRDAEARAAYREALSIAPGFSNARSRLEKLARP